MIHQIHHDLLSDVQKTAAGDIQALSTAFAKFVPFLKARCAATILSPPLSLSLSDNYLSNHNVQHQLYTEYVNGFDKAMQMLDKLEKDKRVKALFEVRGSHWVRILTNEFQEIRAMPESAKLDLRSYLITVRRIN